MPPPVERTVHRHLRRQRAAAIGPNRGERPPEQCDVPFDRLETDPLPPVPLRGQGSLRNRLHPGDDDLRRGGGRRGGDPPAGERPERERRRAPHDRPRQGGASRARMRGGTRIGGGERAVELPPVPRRGGRRLRDGELQQGVHAERQQRGGGEGQQAQQVVAEALGDRPAQSGGQFHRRRHPRRVRRHRPRDGGGQHDRPAPPAPPAPRQPQRRDGQQGVQAVHPAARLLHEVAPLRQFDRHPAGQVPPTEQIEPGAGQFRGDALEPQDELRVPVEGRGQGGPQHGPRRQDRPQRRPAAPRIRRRRHEEERRRQRQPAAAQPDRRPRRQQGGEPEGDLRPRCRGCAGGAGAAVPADEVLPQPPTAQRRGRQPDQRGVPIAGAPAQPRDDRRQQRPERQRRGRRRDPGEQRHALDAAGGAGGGHGGRGL